MEKTLTLNLSLRVSYSQLRWALLLFLLAGTATEISSESYVLTTYYPAPSGVYTRMVTTGQTFLSRDNVAPTGVSIGTKNAPQGMLDVNGVVLIGTYAGNPANPPPMGSSALISNTVGIGTANPSSAPHPVVPNPPLMLDVNGMINATQVVGAVYQ